MTWLELRSFLEGKGQPAPLLQKLSTSTDWEVRPSTGSRARALEDRIVELHAVGGERWAVLLASLMMAFGCLRYTHITRSEPRRLILHCRCLKGKQKQHRDGFDYAIPARWILLGERNH